MCVCQRFPGCRGPQEAYHPELPSARPRAAGGTVGPRWARPEQHGGVPSVVGTQLLWHRRQACSRETRRSLGCTRSQSRLCKASAPSACLETQQGPRGPCGFQPTRGPSSLGLAHVQLVLVNMFGLVEASFGGEWMQCICRLGPLLFN